MRDDDIVKDLICQAQAHGARSLSEHASKQVLTAYGVSAVEEQLVRTVPEALSAAKALGFPAVLKACGTDLAHKSDRGLVRLALHDAADVEAAMNELSKQFSGELLVQRMARGKREIILGGLRDAVFGPCVMLGIGGITVEALSDVSFRIAPVSPRDVREMTLELHGKRLLERFRGEPPVDMDVLTQAVQAVGQLLLDYPEISHVDVNPLIIEQGRPVAVDALISLGEKPGLAQGERSGDAGNPASLSESAFRALFNPQSIVIVGASETPAKWGFRILFNTLEGGYNGRMYAVNPKHSELLGVPCFPDVESLPETPDLALIVIPPPGVPDAVRACAAKGIPAVVVITAGFGELEEAEGRALQEEIVRIAREHTLLLAGPNCAGVASPAPQSLFCGMIARYPGPGGLSIVSQSGNVGSTILTWSQLHQVGVGRFISSGNEAVIRTEDYLDFYRGDERTESIITYVEGARDGRRFYDTLCRTARQKPVVLIKGGRSQAGQRAAYSHTGSLASESNLFLSICHQAGVNVVPETYEAMEVAATFLHQPLPKGRRIGIVSQGGGWGVIAADACVDAGLIVPELPVETLQELDTFMPAWWNRGNPVDSVAGNDLFVLPKAVEVIMKCPDVDAVILLGVGYIASSLNRFSVSERAQQAGLDKLAEMGSHIEVDCLRQIAACIPQYGKPLIVASDTSLLAYVGIPNIAVAELEQLGLCVLSSPTHAARAMAHLAKRYEFLHGIPRV